MGLAVWLLIAFAAAAIGGIATANAGDLYAQLSRPDWAPPAWLFGPVWSVLYLLMGAASWLVWRNGGFAANRAALTLYLCQLAANALWSWLFFEWRQGDWAFLEIVVLWVLIASTIVEFWRIQRLAAFLMIPYLAWVTFAAALAYAIWQLNPTILG